MLPRLEDLQRKLFKTRGLTRKMLSVAPCQRSKVQGSLCQTRCHRSDLQYRRSMCIWPANKVPKWLVDIPGTAEVCDQVAGFAAMGPRRHYGGIMVALYDGAHKPLNSRY